MTQQGCHFFCRNGIPSRPGSREYPLFVLVQAKCYNLLLPMTLTKTPQTLPDN